MTSLRARLVGAMLALLALAFVVVGVTTEVTLKTVLYNRVDAQLTAAAGRAPQGGGGHGSFPVGQTIGTITARIQGGDVVDAGVLVESGQSEPDLTGLYGTLLDVPADARPHTYDLGRLGDYRVVARSAPDGTVLVTGLPLADTDATLYLVAASVGGVTLLVLVLAGVAGTVIVRRTLLPLSRIAATAARVSELRLDRGEVTLPQRVPEPDTDPRTEVGQVGAALNRMLDNVGHALAARHASETQVRQFVADASHELRTPLASIRGYAELSRRSTEPVPAAVAHMLGRVESEAVRMTSLVDDLLLLARLDAGRPLDHEPVDLTLLAIDVAGDAHAAGPTHHWQLDLPDQPVVVTGDPARLHQVLANLLANARVHTPAGTTVTVGVGTDGDRAVLTVTDTGAGIPADLLPRVFERFSRADTSRTRATGSTGLGLAIVGAVVAAHGGTAHVTSRPGRTEVTVSLPLFVAAPVPTTSAGR